MLARESGDCVARIFIPTDVRFPSDGQTDQQVGRRANHILRSPGKLLTRRQRWLWQMPGQDLPPSRSSARRDPSDPTRYCHRHQKSHSARTRHHRSGAWRRHRLQDHRDGKLLWHRRLFCRSRWRSCRWGRTARERETTLSRRIADGLRDTSGDHNGFITPPLSGLATLHAPNFRTRR